MKTRGVGHNFNQTFYNFLHQGDRQIFITEGKFEARKKDKISFVVKKNGSFAFCIDQIADAGNHGIYHYVNINFYNVLLNTIPRLKDIYHTWYLISRENLTEEHPLLTYNQDIDQRRKRLFYFNNVSGDLNTDEMIAPRTEIGQYIKNVNNQDNKNYSLERVRDFEKVFPQERKLLEYENTKNLINNLEENYNNNLSLFEETNKQFFIENEEKKCFHRHIFFTMMLAL